MKKEPKVSVIMAAYNSEKFIEESINSILNQSFKDFELIIINDKSKDNTRNIVEGMQKRDPRIILINNKKNGGPAKSRNNGLKIAKGKYIAILDSDDLSEKRRLETQYNYLEKNPNIFLVGSSAIFIDEGGRRLYKFKKYNRPKILSWRLPKSCGIIHSSVMYRNEGFLYDETFPCAQDYKFYLEALSKGKILTNLPYFLTKYRVSKGSISSSKKKEQIYYREKVKRKYSFLRKKIGVFRKIAYSFFIIFFYILNFPAKKGWFFKKIKVKK